MPRQRKPQNGGKRVWTGRVANTTTGSVTTQTVYRIPAWRDYGGCEKLAYEVVGSSPIRVHIEWENIYRVSLDADALKNVIENYDNLNLSNVTLQTVDGNVTFLGNITAEWEFTGTVVNASTGNITTVNSTSVNAENVAATDVSTATLETTGNATVGWNLTVTWTSTLTWDVTAGSDLSVTWNTTTNGLTATTWTVATLNSTNATIGSLSATTGDITTLTSTSTTTWTLDVTWPSSFTWDVSMHNLSATWASNLSTVVVSSSLNSEGTATFNTITVNGAATLASNASVWGNLSVTGNETITWNMTVTGDGIFSDDVSVAHDLTVSGDATVTDDLTVNGSTHLNTFETTGSGSIWWNLSVDWSIAGWSNLVIENQIESGSIVTTNTTTDNITINWNIALGNNATASDFVLQSEKGEPNGVCPLDANGMVDPQYLPPVYTTAIVKMWTWVFSNSDTSVVVDADITADSFVIISNYSDIVWDLNEVINVGQLTVVSNQTETWSYKYIIVNALPNS